MAAAPPVVPGPSGAGLYPCSVWVPMSRREASHACISAPDAEGLQVLRLGHRAAPRAGDHLRGSGPTGPASRTWSTRSLWVFGEQGAKALRGGKMEDVIFAGTRRPAAAGARRGQPSPSITPTGRCPSTTPRCPSPAGCSGTAPASTRSTATPAGCWTSRSCSPTRASAGRCTWWSGRVSWPPSWSQAGGARAFIERGGRRTQAPQAQGKGAAEAGRDADQPGPG